MSTLLTAAPACTAGILLHVVLRALLTPCINMLASQTRSCTMCCRLW